MKTVSSVCSVTLCNLVKEYISAPLSTGNTFQDLPQLRETVDNTECYM
jgi:hypothetical protein